MPLEIMSSVGTATGIISSAGIISGFREELSIEKRIGRVVDIVKRYIDCLKQPLASEDERQFIKSLVVLDEFKRNWSINFNVTDFLIEEVIETIQKANKEMSPLLCQRFNTEKQGEKTFKEGQKSFYPTFNN